MRHQPAPPDTPLDIRSGLRVAGFLILVDDAGKRHALRVNAILGLQDHDDCATETAVTVSGGRGFVVPRPLEVVLDWIGGRDARASEP